MCSQIYLVQKIWCWNNKRKKNALRLWESAARVWLQMREYVTVNKKSSHSGDAINILLTLIWFEDDYTDRNETCFCIYRGIENSNLIGFSKIDIVNIVGGRTKAVFKASWTMLILEFARYMVFIDNYFYLKSHKYVIIWSKNGLN